LTPNANASDPRREFSLGAERLALPLRSALVRASVPMQITIATCPHCRAKLGLRTTFALANLWDPRTAGPIGLRPEFLCYQCGHHLGYPANTALSFIALAVLPLLMIGLMPDLRPAGMSTISLLFTVYLTSLAIFYSHFATPIVARKPTRPSR
jgi:hypothetical protein